MIDVQFSEDAYGNAVAIIDRGNGEFTSMPKDIYDKMIADANNNTAF